MLTNWIYNNPTWLWGSIFVVLFTALACLGLVISHRLIDHHFRRSHNELVGFNIAVVGVLYAVLLAFIAIVTWEAYTKASETAENESDFAGSLYLLAGGLPDAKSTEIRSALANYVNVVINKEWPEQRRGIAAEEGWKPLSDVSAAIVSIRPETSGEAVIEAELLKTWNQLYSARSARLSAAEEHVPGVIWAIIFAGAAIQIIFTYFFGFENFRMHMTITASMAVTLAIVIVMIIALDWPFRGEISVSANPFIMTQQSWKEAIARGH